MSLDAQLYDGRERACPCKTLGCKRTTFRNDALCVPCSDLLASRSPAVNGGDASSPPGRIPATPSLNKGEI